MREAGTGTNLFAMGEIDGTARWFRSPGDVLSVDEEELPDIVAFVEKGGMTFLSPIIADLRCVVCTAGSRESHLAILAREYGVPCVMGAELDGEIPDGTQVRLDLSDAQTARIAVADGEGAAA